MAARVNPECIATVERELAFEFPAAWRSMLERQNGGEFVLADEHWQIHSVWDGAARRPAGRTANDLQSETEDARKWTGFPADAIALGNNGHGDLLIVVPGSVSVFRWDHEEALTENLGDLDPLPLMNDVRR